MSVSGYSWLLDRPPRVSLDIPPSTYEPAPSHISSSGPSEIPIPELLHDGVPFPNPSSSASWETRISDSSIPSWLQELDEEAANWQQMQLDGTTTESHSPTEKFTPSHHPSSLSSATIPSPKYASASDGSLSYTLFLCIGRVGTSTQLDT